MTEPNTKLSPKQKAVEHIRKIRMLSSAMIMDDVYEAIDIALEEQAKQIFQEIDNVIIDIYSEDKGRVDMDLNIRKIRDKWLK